MKFTRRKEPLGTPPPLSLLKKFRRTCSTLPPPKKYKRICSACSKEFETNYSSKKFCNDRCKNLFYRRDKKPYKKICPTCLKEFETHDAEQIFCSEKCNPSPEYSKVCPFCGTPHNGRGDKCKECRAAIDRGRRNLKKEPPPPTTPKKPLSEWIAEARECNLDYGTYRALIESGKTFEELKATSNERTFPHHAHGHRSKRD